MGIILAIVLVFQSYTLPDGNALFSLFPFGKNSSLGRNSSSTGKSSPDSMMVSNLTILNNSNSMNSSLGDEVVNNTEVFDLGKKDERGNGTKENDKSPKSDFEEPIRARGRNPVNDSSLEQFVAQDNSSTLDNVRTPDNGDTVEKAREPEAGLAPVQVNRTDGNPSVETGQRADSGFTLGNVGAPETSVVSILPAIPPALNNMTLLRSSEENSSASVLSISSNISSNGKQGTEMRSKDENPGQLNTGSITSENSSKTTHKPEIKKGWAPRTSMAKMNSLLLQSRVSSHSMKPKWPSKCDEELLHVKSQIKNSPIIKNDKVLYPYIYRNVSTFKRSYEMMERTLKVYIYGEGEKPIFHVPTEPILKGIYASEGWFMKVMEDNKQFVVKDPRKAHLFYMPFSSRMLQLTLYVRNSHKRNNLAEYLKNYVDMIASKYPFWNRTGGADHFLVACHDWAPFETRHHMDNCIKVLCNANAARDFRIGKDVTLPETQVRKVEDPLRDLGGKPPSKRSILAFFAGGMHGYLRPILLQYWKNDPDMKIYGEIPRVYKGMNYVQHMKSSKYCICARGYEVNSPRVVEALFYECVPVFIADNYVPPFFEVLDWEAFAVFVPEEDIPKLKDILLSIPEKKYLEMHQRVKKVQQHFLWHSKPVKYDIFHMILHSVWFNRLNRI
ncbi:Exostosin-like [Macleaya cordata]|uniref:Exostosin-like n=1 Tax=Macleaya cordata TaxID=56857 RepID=A0A200QDN0_MACCD|nr:Exostosin-like [Macleaya cordata]